MKVVMVEPGQYARAAEIGDGLESLQKAVGGLIDCAYPWRDQRGKLLQSDGRTGAEIPEDVPAPSDFFAYGTRRRVSGV